MPRSTVPRPDAYADRHARRFPIPRSTSHRLAGALLALGATLALVASPLRASDVLVFEFELNDLTLYPNVEQEAARVASLRPLLVAALADEDAVDTIEPSAAAAREARPGSGYLFERPSVAARLARESGADWALSGRLHKASHLFVYLKAQLVDAADGRVAADFVVEIKGWGEKLTKKGVEALAVQIVEALGTLDERPSGAGAATGRPPETDGG